MHFNRPELNASANSLAGGTDVDESCVGCNYLIEENVSDQRRDDVETYRPQSNDVREVVKDYFFGSIQGVVRDHKSSTFDEAINDLALLPASIEPTQKLIRLEKIDDYLEPNGGLKYEILIDALQTGDDHRLSALTDEFQNYSGERPAFAAFKSEVSEDLSKSDWLRRLIDRLGLYHNYPFSPVKSYRFALMEYTAGEVITQAQSKGIGRCFSLATVLECRDNAAFFPVPRSTSHGFTVDLRERNPKRPSVREILHIRFDYSSRHVKRLVEWLGEDLPDITAARDRHLDALRTETGRRDFGDVGG